MEKNQIEHSEIFYRISLKAFEHNHPCHKQQRKLFFLLKLFDLQVDCFQKWLFVGFKDDTTFWCTNQNIGSRNEKDLTSQLNKRKIIQQG